ncbi:hypothetical protein A2U01_0093288, partial [Trifolium medium]|nr:hypothetical protein [Trifolium medium]
MAFVLQEKLRGLKVRLKDWSMVEFGSVDVRSKKLVDEIQVLDIRGETLGLANHE